MVYSSYVLSAYALILLCVSVPHIAKKSKGMLEGNSYGNRYLSQREFRARVSLYSGLGINFLYAVFNATAGVIYQSTWMGAVAGYYLVLVLIRFLLMRGDRAAAKNKDDSYVAGLGHYRLTGILMFLLNLAMSAMIAQMLWQNQSHSYPGFMIYASAAYTFYSVVMAIVNLVKYYKLNNPVLSAAKMLSFATALVSLLVLQTALITQFGNDESFQRLMNAITGSCVSIIVFAMAVFMIVRSNRELNYIHLKEKSNGT